MKEGWEYKKLKEVGLTQTGTTPSKQIKAYYGGDIPFIRPAELNVDQNGGVQYDSELKLTEEGALKSRVIKANSVLMCCIGSVGKTGYTLNNVTCNQQINTLTPYDNYNPRFVYYALISPFFQQEVIKIANSAKATLPIISKGKWEILSIPVPPLSEQQSIVDYLDSAFAKIDAMKANAEKRLNEAKALFQASLKKMLEPKEGWEEKKMGDICEIIRGKRFVRTDIVEEGVPCIHYGDIYTHYGLSVTKTRGCIKPELAKKMRFAEKNDVVVVQAGENNWDIGVGIAYFGDEPAAVHDACFILKHKQNPMYISYYLRSYNYHWYLLDYVHEGKICSFLKPALENAPISLPPLSTQQSIVATLNSLKSKVDKLQANYEKISQECDALKQAILRKVFE